MSAEQNRTLGYRWADLWNHEKELSVIDEIVDPNFVSHSAPPGLAPGIEGVRQWATLFRKAFPDIYSVADDVIVEGDKVVERFTSGGTHKGDFFGMPPTGVAAQSPASTSFVSKMAKLSSTGATATTWA